MLARRVEAANRTLRAKRWRSFQRVPEAPEARIGDWLFSTGVAPFLSLGGGLLFEASYNSLTLHRVGEGAAWKHEWPRHIAEAHGTTCDDDGCGVPCGISKGVELHVDPPTGLLAILIRYNSGEDTCMVPSGDHVFLTLPSEDRAVGWKKVMRDPAPGWLDLPRYTEEPDKLSEGAVDHIKEVLGRWEPFFPAAPCVRALRATLDAHEGRATKPVP